MARYHISPHTGDPGVCSAKVNCPYGNLETDHFDTPEAARAAYEAGQLEPAFATLRKALDDVTANAFESANDYPQPSALQTIHDLAARDQAILDEARSQGYGDEIDAMGLSAPQAPLSVFMRSYDRDGLASERDAYLTTSELDTVSPEVASYSRDMARLCDIASEMKAKEDQAILDGVEKAGWPVFDPNKGPGQFTDAIARADNQAPTMIWGQGNGKTTSSAGSDEGVYHLNGTDEPALTDEAMDEMGAHLDAADKKFRTVRVLDLGDYNEDDEYVNRYEVEVSDYGRFETDDYDITVAAKRVADAGEWGELESWDEAPDVKLRYVERYMRKPNALDYIADGRLDNADKLVALGDADDLGTASKRFRINLDNALLDVAEKTLRSEADAKAASDLLGNRTDTPPF